MKVIFVTTTKPFNDIFGFRQQNAILSWKNLNFDKEILICGDEDGAGDFCKINELTHIPNIDCSESGIPYIHSLLSEAYSRSSKGDVVFYTNADMIYLSDVESLVSSIKTNNLKNYFMTGRRWDWNSPISLEFPLNEPEFCDTVESQGKFHKWTGADYFIHSVGLLEDIPNFSIARAFYDNWIIAHCIKRFFNSFDVSEVVFSIHQDHGYGFDGDLDTNGIKNKFKKEFEYNRKFGGAMADINHIKRKAKYLNGEVVFQ